MPSRPMDDVELLYRRHYSLIMTGAVGEFLLERLLLLWNH